MSSLPCKDCFTGELKSGTPTGTESTIHDLPTYISAPPEGVTPKGLIVMVPDMYGWRMPNNRLLCDIYAGKGGWLVYLPDFMDGKSLPQSHMQTMAELTTPSTWTHTLLSKPALLARAIANTVPPAYGTRSAVCASRVLDFFKSLRTSPPPAPLASVAAPLKIGVAGFCWGGQHAISLAQDLPASRVARHPSQDPSSSSSGLGGAGREMQLVDCAFTAHPSFFSIPGDVEKVVVPLSVAVGDADMALSGKNVKLMKAVLDAKGKGKGGEEYECVVLEGANHGFAVRSCVTDELQTGYAEVAEKQALQWFEKWMG